MLVNTWGAVNSWIEDDPPVVDIVAASDAVITFKAGSAVKVFISGSNTKILDE